MYNERVAAVSAVDYSPELIGQKIDQALELLGGLGQFVQPGDRVLLEGQREVEDGQKIKVVKVVADPKEALL